MIPRYTRPEMAAIWSPEARFGIWLEIETLAAEAMENLGIIPEGTTAKPFARRPPSKWTGSTRSNGK
jgi:adenylosuccinate lyase